MCKGSKEKGSSRTILKDSFSIIREACLLFNKVLKMASLLASISEKSVLESILDLANSV